MYVNANGTRLYVDVHGSQLRVGDGGMQMQPTVVVLHGGPGFDQGYLRPGLDPLAALAQVVYVDLRGQGRSAAVAPQSCTLETMADAAAVAARLFGGDMSQATRAAFNTLVLPFYAGPAHMDVPGPRNRVGLPRAVAGRRPR